MSTQHEVRAVSAQTAARGGRLKRHALFLVALLGGIAIRLVVVYAYRPALVFHDTGSYYRQALNPDPSRLRPIGYALILRPLVLLNDSLATIAVFHHVIGLLLAVACYAFLVRRGLAPWAATLATLPLLFDPLQLVLEHYVLSDVVFEGLVVLACLLLLWKERPGYGLLVAAGAAVGVSALTRSAGTFVLVVFLVAVLCLRVGWLKLTAFVVAALLPIGAYAVVFHAKYGEYALATAGPRFLYSRLAPIVHCRDPQLVLPAYEEKLCPAEPVGSRRSSGYYMWGKHRGPQYHLEVPPGMTAVQVIKDFDKRVVRSQPVTFGTAALKDFALGFAPARTYDVPGFPSRYWLFADHYWTTTSPRWHPRAYAPAAGFLQTYRQWVYTPGPLTAALLLVAAAATLGLGRARRSGDRVAIGLLAGACLLTLLTGAALSGFSWRYQLPQLPLLPMAGALGLAALVRGRAEVRPAPAPPVRSLDRAAGTVARLPGPWRPGLRRASDSGRLQWFLAVAVGLVTAAVCALGTVASGWVLPGWGALIGGTVGAVAALLLLGSRLRKPDAAPRN